jgi:hypothetical protein
MDTGNLTLVIETINDKGAGPFTAEEIAANQQAFVDAYAAAGLTVVAGTRSTPPRGSSAV